MLQKAIASDLSQQGAVILSQSARHAQPTQTARAPSPPVCGHPAIGEVASPPARLHVPHTHPVLGAVTPPPPPPVLAAPPVHVPPPIAVLGPVPLAPVVAPVAVPPNAVPALDAARRRRQHRRGRDHDRFHGHRGKKLPRRSNSRQRHNRHGLRCHK